MPSNTLTATVTHFSSWTLLSIVVPTPTPTPTPTPSTGLGGGGFGGEAPRIAPRGDINGDLIVDVRDLAIIASSFGKAVGIPGFRAEADLNGDGLVDIRDLAILAANFGRKA